MSGFGDGTGPKNEKQVSRGGLGAPWEPGLALDLGPTGNDEGRSQGPDQAEGCLSSLQAIPWQLELDSGSEPELEVIQAGVAGLWGNEDRPSTPAPNRKGAVASMSRFTEGCADIVQPLSHTGFQAMRRFQSIESRATQAAAIRAHVEAGPGGRGALGWSCVESMQACAAPRHVNAPGKEGRGRRHSKRRAARRRSSTNTDDQRTCGEGLAGLPPDTESSDDLRDMQLRGAGIHLKRDSQAKCSNLAQPAESPRRLMFHRRETFPHISGPVLTSTVWGLTCAMERQVLGESMPSSSTSSKKMQKGGGRPRFPRGDAAATGGGTEVLPQASPRRQSSQEKKSPGNAPGVVLGTIFSPWGKRQAAAPIDPATIPPVSGISLLRKSSTSSSLPWEPKQSKQGCAGKKSGARRKSQSVDAGEFDPNRSPEQRAYLPARRSGRPCWYVPHGEFSTGDSDTQDPQVAANFQPLSPSQGGATSRGPTISGEQEPPVPLQRPEMEQLPPGIEGCPRCAVLQQEIEDLREEIVLIQSFIEKFQGL